jgi:hypothetical protein
LVQTGHPFKAIKGFQEHAIDGIDLSVNQPRPLNSHRKGSQVVNHDPWHGGIAAEAGATHAPMVDLTPLQGAVNEHQ